MSDIDFIQVIYDYMEEDVAGNIYQQLKADINYQKATNDEQKCYQKFEALEL